MPNNEFLSDIELLCVGFAVVMVIFIFLWNECNKSKEDLITKDECEKSKDDLITEAECKSWAWNKLGDCIDNCDNTPQCISNCIGTQCINEEQGACDIMDWADATCTDLVCNKKI